MSVTGSDELHRASSQEKWLMEEPANIQEDHEKNAALQERKLIHLRDILEKVKHELTKEQEQRALQKKDFERKQAAILKESTAFKNKSIVERSIRLQKEEELKKLRRVKMINDKLNAEVVTLNHRVQDLVGFKNFADKKMEEQNFALKSWEKQHIDLTEKMQEILAISSQCKYELAELNQVNQKYQTEKEKCRKQDMDLKKHINHGEAYRSQIRAFKMTTKDLRTELKECNQCHTDLQEVVVKMREKEKNLMTDAEHQKKEAEKQRQLIGRMEEELNNLSNMKTKLQTKERDLIKHNLTKDEEVQYFRNLICDSEGKQRLLVIEAESLKDEKKHIQLNLVKTQEELDEKHTADRKMREEVRILNVEAEAQNERLVKANQNNISLKKLVKKKRLQLAESKKLYADLKKSEAFLLGSIKLNEVLTEKEKFEKEVLRCHGMIEQQQMRLNLQDAATVSLERSIQECRDETRFFQLENKRLKDALYIKQSKERQTRTFFSNPSKRRNLRWSFQINSQWTLVQKNVEITELRRKLARRPDKAILKLKKCQWDNRDLRKKLEGVQGQLQAFKELHQKVSEENKELICTLKKMNFEFEKKRTPLPPISKTPNPPTEGRFKTHFQAMKSEDDQMTNIFIPMFPPLPPPRIGYRLASSRQTRFPIPQNPV